MKRYTNAEIESLSKNPCVKLVKEDRLILTYEFRTEIYKHWVLHPCYSTIRRILDEHGFDRKCVEINYIKDLHRNFKRHGKPRNGKRELASRDISSESDINKLLESGKFIKSGKGIAFAEDFVEQLRSKYPEQTIEEGLRNAGINPEIVGYQRIYTLERRFLWINTKKCRNEQSRQEYTEEELAAMSVHPYVERATAKMLRFSSSLYKEANVLILNGYSLADIMNVFKIPEEWLSQSKQIALNYKIKAGSSNQYSETSMTEWSTEKTAKYAEIQRKRIEAMENIVQHNYEALQEQIPKLNLLQKKRVCEWIRDDLLPISHTRGNDNSLPKVLERLKISRSVYFRLIKDETVEERAKAAAAKEETDMDVIRKVAEYGGYPKGSRQIYMQMPIITEGQSHMSRGKIIRLMRKMNIRSSVRKLNVNRQAERKRLKSHVKPNILKRRFKLHRPGKAILTDVTYLRYNHDKKLAYASASVDAVTGRLYEMNVSEINDVALVIQTINALPRPDRNENDAEKPLIHSDQGVQYLSDAYQELLKELGYIQSMSKRGNCWDNAPQESFFGHFKDEVNYGDLNTIDELRDELIRYKAYYNDVRGQWNRDKMTPVQREAWINGLNDEEYEAWQKKETEKYEKMKEESRKKAIERNRTLGV